MSAIDYHERKLKLYLICTRNLCTPLEVLLADRTNRGILRFAQLDTWQSGRNKDPSNLCDEGWEEKAASGNEGMRFGRLRVLCK